MNSIGFILSFASVILNIVMYGAIIYFILGPARKLANSTMSYLESKKIETATCEKKENTEEPSKNNDEQ